METKILRLDDVGDVKMIKNHKAKNMSIRIKPMEGVIVTIPGKLSFAEAENFVFRKLAWIRKNSAKMKHIENGYTVFRHTTEFFTRQHQLLLVKEERENTRISISSELITVYYPFEKNVEDPSIQEAIRFGIEETWRREAKEYLPTKTQYLSNIHGFKYRNITIKNAKTRWGSCSYQDNINFSLHLMRLPEHLIDYVILHELCHTVHKDHSRNFWDLLDKVSGNAKAYVKEMKNYRIGIY
jgi:predicted metal-dependent hydrolase